MPPQSRSFRLLACVLAIVLVVTFAAPARAEADVLAAIAIGTLVVAGLVLIAYLIIANMSDSQQGQGERIIWVACTDCPVPVAGVPASLRTGPPSFPQAQ